MSPANRVSTRLSQLSSLVVVLGTIGCAGDQTGSVTGPSPSGNPPSASVSVTAADLAFCTSETNRYRAQVGQGPLTQAPDLDAYALRAAQADHASGIAHEYIRANPPAGNWAENSAVRWPHNRDLRNMIGAALAQMWAEGPGGGHHENIRNPAWRRIGCAVHVDGNAATFVQEFRP